MSYFRYICYINDCLILSTFIYSYCIRLFKRLTSVYSSLFFTHLTDCFLDFDQVGSEAERTLLGILYNFLHFLALRKNIMGKLKTDWNFLLIFDIVSKLFEV